MRRSIVQVPTPAEPIQCLQQAMLDVEGAGPILSEEWVLHLTLLREGEDVKTCLPPAVMSRIFQSSGVKVGHQGVTAAIKTCTRSVLGAMTRGGHQPWRMEEMKLYPVSLFVSF
jgi:hypothetical protein